MNFEYDVEDRVCPFQLNSTRNVVAMEGQPGVRIEGRCLGIDCAAYFRGQCLMMRKPEEA